MVCQCEVNVSINWEALREVGCLANKGPIKVKNIINMKKN
jgi:hypothetical protein